MKYLLALPLLALIPACAEVSARATDLGVSEGVQTACASAAANAVASIDEDTDFDVVMDELRDRGKACLIAAVRDVLTAQIVDAAPQIAGEVVAATPAAAAAIAAE